MAYRKIEDATLTAIANAIRGKTGKTDTMLLSNMVTEIESIETGGSGGDEVSLLNSIIDGTVTEITIPKEVTQLREYLFHNSENLKNVTILGDVQVVAAECFGGCKLLETVELPDTVEMLDANAFRYCARLTMETLPQNLKTIEGRVFEQCWKNNTKEIPASVTTIKQYAFNYNEGMTELTFKGTPTSISQSAFYNCKNITTINVPWASGAVENAPWGATNATINYNYTGE